MHLNDFHNICRYIFGKWLWICFGIIFSFSLAPFRHQCSCFGVLVFYMICWLFFSHLFCDFATQNGAHESGRAAEPPKSRFVAGIVPRTFLLSIRPRFWIDFAMSSRTFSLGVRFPKTFPLGLRWYFAIQMINVYILARWRNRGLPHWIIVFEILSKAVSYIYIFRLSIFAYIYIYIYIYLVS